MVGYPGETYDTIETTFKWALSLPLDEISFTIPYPLPGTRLYNRVMHVNAHRGLDNMKMKTRMVFQSDFDEDYLKKRIDSIYKQFEYQTAKPERWRPDGRSVSAKICLNPR
jgi:anaerobic magnesium-protoporphyrin IX monomethyl ester cyclase